LIIPIGISIDVLFDSVIIVPYLSYIMVNVGRSLVVAGFVGLITSIAGKQALVGDIAKELTVETEGLVKRFSRAALRESLDIYGNPKIAEIWENRTKSVMGRYATRPWVLKAGSEVRILRRKRSTGVPGYLEFSVNETIVYRNLSRVPTPLPPWNKIVVVTWDQYALKQRDLVFDPAVKYFVVPGEPVSGSRMIAGPDGYQKPEEGPRVFVRGQLVLPTSIEAGRTRYLHEYSIPSLEVLEPGKDAEVRFEATVLLPENQSYYLYLVPDFGEGLVVTFKTEERDFVIDGVPVYSDVQCDTMPRINALQTCTVPMSGVISPGDFVRFDWSPPLRTVTNGGNPGGTSEKSLTKEADQRRLVGLISNRSRT